MKINDVIDMLEDSFRIQIETGQRQTTELIGPPGVGKSQLVQQFVNRISTKWSVPVGLETMFLSTYEPPDVAGNTIPAKEGDQWKTVITAPPWERLLQHEYSVFFLDEFRQADHAVQKAAAEILNGGRAGRTQLPITCLVITASNRAEDRSGITKPLAFLQNRVNTVQVEPYANVWCDWAERNGIHPMAITYARRRPGNVFSGKVPEKDGPFCTPRTLVRASYALGRMPMERFTEWVGGVIGVATGADFIQFLRTCDGLPTFEEIVANPTTCVAPRAPDAQYAQMQMVSFHVTDDTVNPAFEYLKRLGRDFQVAGLRAIAARNPRILGSPSFLPWLRENKDLVLAANLMS